MPIEPHEQPCPLCGESAGFHAESRWGRYFRCAHCDLVSQAREEWPDPASERRHYATHENSPDDPAYRKFLSRLTAPLFARLLPGSVGLDYGCGPGPAISIMAVEAGFRMSNFDPLFANEAALLEREYDFITCTEAAEHFHDPATEFARLDRMIRPGGWLGLMTELHDEVADFAAWWYHRDPTHVVFYSRRTLDWLGKRFGWELDFTQRAVSIFRKS